MSNQQTTKAQKQGVDPDSDTHKSAATIGEPNQLADYGVDVDEVLQEQQADNGNGFIEVSSELTPQEKRDEQISASVNSIETTYSGLVDQGYPPPSAAQLTELKQVYDINDEQLQKMSKELRDAFRATGAQDPSSKTLVALIATLLETDLSPIEIATKLDEYSSLEASESATMSLIYYQNRYSQSDEDVQSAYNAIEGEFDVIIDEFHEKTGWPKELAEFILRDEICCLTACALKAQSTGSYSTTIDLANQYKEFYELTDDPYLARILLLPTLSGRVSSQDVKTAYEQANTVTNDPEAAAEFAKDFFFSGRP